MPTRGNLTDAQWMRLRPFLPPVKPARGRPNKPHRRIINAILWVLRTGAPWRDLPRSYGPWSTVYSRFRRWRILGIWAAILQRLRELMHRQGLIDWSTHHIDGTVIRAHQDAAGARKAPGEEPESSRRRQKLGKSRGGLTTKSVIRVDALGHLISMVLLPGQRHDIMGFVDVMEKGAIQGVRGRPRLRPRRVVGDKGFSAKWTRAWLKERNVRQTIAKREDENRTGPFDREIYRGRNVVERTIGRYKQKFRRLATRYDKLGSSYESFWDIAAIYYAIK